jgi:hypothetical protein
MRGYDPNEVDAFLAQLSNDPELPTHFEVDLLIASVLPAWQSGEPTARRLG